MIKNTHQEFENLIRDGTAPESDRLLEFLESLGLDFSVDEGRVCLDESLQLLDESVIRRQLADMAVIPAAPVIGIFRTVESTNNEALKALGEPGDGHFLITAEMQTAGKGRRGRHWVSPFGRNVYMSYARFLQRPLADLGGLSLIAGMEVVEALRQLGVTGAGLKWPNDVLLDDGKLAGILVELKPAEQRGIGVVIGIGINLSLSARHSDLIDQSWSHLGEWQIDRSQLIGKLLKRLLLALEQFNREGFAPFAAKWPTYNLYADTDVRVIRGAEIFSGKDRGIDLHGNLQLETPGGVIESHNSGEVSMRPLESVR